jgi:hypothetical protein
MCLLSRDLAWLMAQTITSEAAGIGSQGLDCDVCFTLKAVIQLRPRHVY